MAVLLDPPPTRWVCANGCGISDLTPAGVSNRFHACSALAGILAPLVPEGQRCEVLAVEREDYIGDQIVRRDGNGRPVMAVITVRDEGEDRVVFAPTARTGSGS